MIGQEKGHGGRGVEHTSVAHTHWLGCCMCSKMGGGRGREVTHSAIAGYPKPHAQESARTGLETRSTRTQGPQVLTASNEALQQGLGATAPPLYACTSPTKAPAIGKGALRHHTAHRHTQHRWVRREWCWCGGERDPPEYER